MRGTIIGVGALLLLGSALSGCASTCTPRCGCPCPPPCETATLPPPTPTPPRWPAPGTIVDHRDGSTVSFDALVDRLATVPVVYVGETHDQAEHHRLQARVFEALAAKPGGTLALGMEMFSKPFQGALDAYVKKEIDEKTMLEKTEWTTRWGFGWEMYAPMLRLCREKGLPIVALNAPKEITRTVSKKGLEGLTPEQRATVPPLDMNVEGHRKFVKQAFGAHGASMPADMFERFYTSQVIWEETMSSSVADWLATAGPGARMMVVVGGGHVGDRFGVPLRAARKSSKPYLAVMCMTLPPKGEEEGGPDRMDVGFADYSAWFNDSAPPKPAKPATPAKPEAPAGAPGTLPKSSLVPAPAADAPAKLP